MFKAIIDQFTDSYNTTLQRHIMEYIASQAHLQGVPNRSGGLSDGAGLGEPKFNVDESAFTGDWGQLSVPLPLNVEVRLTWSKVVHSATALR